MSKSKTLQFTSSDNAWLELIRDNQLEFIDDLALLLSMVKEKLEVRFYISKYRSLYIYLSENAKYVHTCRISDHHNETSHENVMLDLVLEGGFAAPFENSGAIKELEKEWLKRGYLRISEKIEKSVMNRESKYDDCDWSKEDSELAKKFGVSRQAIQAARKVRGIKQVTAHGGKRIGSGAKPKRS